jgi:abortive infection bacteriophage resistance protein
MEYGKPWLSVGEQIEKLRRRGCRIDDQASGSSLLREVGYYRLTGYLYPFRESSVVVDDDGHRIVVVRDRYRTGTDIRHAEAFIDFDRRLRLLVIEAVERVEVAVRTQLGHVLGARSPFAHEDPTLFTGAFATSPATDIDRVSPHAAWLRRVAERQNSSDEAFVGHFRTKYDGRMPIWALTEILELGHLARLYGGLRNDIATEIARSFGVPTKKTMVSWLSSVNYVRNVSAHHARLFNRKLVAAPKRPRPSDIPLLGHLSDGTAPKEFGVYNTLAVLAYLLRSIPSDRDWAPRAATLVRSFPTAGSVTVASMGVAAGWLDEPLWAVT